MKQLKTAHQHIALDLYFQALKASKEMEDILTNISTRKESIEFTIKMFQRIYNLEENEKPNIETFLINQNTHLTKKQIKAYKKLLKSIGVLNGKD